MKGNIIVVTHKDYRMPSSSMYIPICVGSEVESLKNKYQPDNVGQNISKKNNLYCELTAIYWAWRNLNVDFIGVAHYRRYFTLKRHSKNLRDIITNSQIVELFNQCDVIVTKSKRYINSVKKHYIKCIKSRKESHKIHLSLLRSVISDMNPEYVDALNVVLDGHKAHMLNMFIMKKKEFDSYCNWLFPILFELEKRIDSSKVMYDRIMGAFSEFLLDVWIKKNNLNFYECYVYETEKNLFKKIKWALKRKLFE